MAGSDKVAEAKLPQTKEVNGLKEAVREARIEAAERSGNVVDLRDAEVARLDLLNETLDPLFAEIPSDVDLFDRGISRGMVPRLWIDVVAHVEMGRDKRSYRFVQDTRYGRKVLAESYEVSEIAASVRRYVAHRLVDREKALAGDEGAARAASLPTGRAVQRGSRRGRGWIAFFLGLLCGIGALVALAMLNMPR